MLIPDDADLVVTVSFNPAGTVEVRGQPAIDLVMRLCPSALEGRKFKYARHSWAFHNLIAHPLMQLLAFVGKSKAGLAIHDMTIPRPTSKR